MSSASVMQDDPAGAVEIAQALDNPISNAFLASNLGTAHYQLGNYPQAERFYRLAIQLKPAHESFRGNLGDALRRQGRGSEAQNQYLVASLLVRERLRVLPEAEDLQVSAVFFGAKAGDCDRAMSAAARLERRLNPVANHFYRLSKAYAVCSRDQLALDALEKAIDLGATTSSLVSEDEFEGLIDKPRFQALLRQP